MAKPRKKQKPINLRVKIFYQASSDHQARLARVFQLLLRPVAEQPDNKRGTPPTDRNNGGPTSGTNGEDKNYGP